MNTDDSGGGRLSPMHGLAATFGLFRSHPHGLTKTEVARLSGLSRTSINQRLEPLLDKRLLVPSPAEASTGGRPAERFVLNPEIGQVLVADVGASGVRAALCDANSQVRSHRYVPIDVASGPLPVLEQVTELFHELLAEHSESAAGVSGIAIDVPGPVDHKRGRVISPPIMTGWHDFDIPGFLGPRFDAPVLVEKDVNAMAFGEHRVAHPNIPMLVFVKVGTGIGTGIVAFGEIYRGADGAAGDIGHIQIIQGETDAPLCRCGNYGCVEAHAGGWALQRDLAALGLEVQSVTEVLQVIRDGHPQATRLFKTAAATIGSAVSDIVNVLNPRIVVLGGQLAAVEDVLFAVVREVVYRRSLPLATRRLQIIPSTLGDKAGVAGLTRLVSDRVWDADGIARLLERAPAA
jgi:predicted NBD/HSP70 family sugar kinase